MDNMKDVRKRILETLDELENEIQILLTRINNVRVAESVLDDDEFVLWIDENDLEDGFEIIRLV